MVTLSSRFPLKKLLSRGWVDYSPVTIASKVRSETHVLALTPAQIARLIVEANPDTMLLIQFAASTGMRIGELFGSRWLDVDLEAARVAVRQQYSHGQFAELKTRKARRSIPIPAALLNPLCEWKLRQPKGVLGLVFPSSSGGPADAHNFYGRVWKPLLKKADLPLDTRFHALRHSFATALIAGSENAKTVQSLMGHSSVAFTLDVYTDYWPESFEGIASRVSDRLFADVEAARAAVDSKLVAGERSAEIPGAQVIGLIGGPWAIRTVPPVPVRIKLK